MTDEKVTRRKAIHRATGIAGAAALGSVVLGSGPVQAEAVRAGAAGKLLPVPVLDAEATLRARNDVTAVIRNCYVNRTPVVARLNWAPTDHAEFLMFSHRPAREGDLTGHGYVRGLRTFGTAVPQWCERFVFPVLHPGHAAGYQALAMWPQSPFDFKKMVQLGNMIDAVETSLYYGKGQTTRSAGGREQALRMHGFRSLIRTNRRKVDWADYSMDEFAADLGADTDLVLVPTHMTNRYSQFEIPLGLKRIGNTVFGGPIWVFNSSVLPGKTIVEAPLLMPGDVIGLNSSEVCIRVLVNPHWNPRSHEVDGEWVCDLALDLINEHHHRFISDY